VSGARGRPERSWTGHRVRTLHRHDTKHGDQQARNFASLFEALPGKQWKPYRQQTSKQKSKQRKRGPNCRRERALARNKRNLQLKKQWIAELPYQPERSEQSYRLIARYQEVEEYDQGELFTLTRFRFILSNAAFMICARLAHNLKPWLAQLALPRETMRWEWKRFRRCFVYCAARVVHTARQTHVRFAGSHRFAGETLAAHARLAPN
jgi:hypothetical protein